MHNNNKNNPNINQQLQDLKIQLDIAIKHGDAVEDLLSEQTEQLVQENIKQSKAEKKIKKLLFALEKEKSGLEFIIESIIDHSDRLNLHLLEQYKIVKAQSLTDDLTGIPNRRSFDNQIKQIWKQARLQNYLFGFALLDIDYFKQYNDYYGHIEGDNCLRKVAMLISNTCYRDTDFVARFGGEEFAILMSVKDIDGAKTFINRIHQTFLNEAIAHKKTLLEKPILTVSIGCGLIKPHRKLSTVNFIKKVDELLYQAKKEGRNQVCYQQF